MFAIRRTWALPVRTTLALLTCVLAWFVVIGAQLEARHLERQSARAGELGGETGYRLEMQRVHEREGVLRSTALPEELVALAYRAATLRIVQLKNEQVLSLDDRTKSAGMNMLFYAPALDPARSPREDGFPVCSLIQAPQDWEGFGFLVFTRSNWRCKLVPLPAALDFLRFDRAQPALALPLSAMNETVGRLEGKAIEIIWFGQSDRRAIQPIQDWSRHDTVSPIALTRLGQELAGHTSSLSQATRRWVIVAATLLACGMGLYIQGTYGKMRRELGLRLCIGMPVRAILLWLGVDIGIQILHLAAISFVIAFIVQFPASYSIAGPAFALFTLVVGLVLVVIAVLCTIVVRLAGRSRFLVRMIAE